MVKACVALHNFLRKQNQVSNITADTETAPGNWREFSMDGLTAINPTAARHPQSVAAQVRDEFTIYFNGVGAVPWQERMI